MQRREIAERASICISFSENEISIMQNREQKMGAVSIGMRFE